MVLSDRLRLAIYVALFSIVLRLIWAGFAVVTPVSDFLSFDQMGWRWLTEGQFGSPLGPAHRTPGFPAYLAVVYLVFGHSWKAVGLVNGVMGGVSSGLLVLLAARIVSLRASVIAGLLHAMSPAALAYVPVLASLNPGVFLLVAALLTLALARERAGRWRYVLAVVSGVLSCLLVLTRPACVLMVPAFVLLAAYDLRQRRWTLGFGTAYVLAAGLSFMPWSIRNATIGLSPLTLSTQGGLGLWWDIHPYVYPELRERIPSFARGLPPAQRDAACKAAAFRWIYQHPGLYLRLCRTRLARILGPVPDYWAAVHLPPTRANDEASLEVFRAGRSSSRPSPALAARHDRNRLRAATFLRRYRVVLAPLALFSLVLAGVRTRTFGLVILPVLCYLVGLALLVFIERYRQLVDPLVFIPVAALVSDVVFGTRDLGSWLPRLAKLAIAVVMVGASIFVAETQVSRSWYEFPAVPAVCAPEPDVGDLAFTPVTFHQSPESYASYWRYGTDHVTLTREGNGLRCDIVGGADASAKQYGGIRFRAAQPAALRMDLALIQPEHIECVFVDGYDAKGKRKLRWRWQCSAGARPDGGPRRYTFVPGRDVGYFRADRGADATGVEWVHVFVQIVPGKETGFVLERAEWGRSSKVSAPDPGAGDLVFTPVTFHKPPESYASHWRYGTDRVTLTREGSGLRCDIVGGADASVPQYGGIGFAVDQPAALRLDLTLIRPEHVERVFVDACDAKGKRKLRWRWQLDPGAHTDRDRRCYTFTPGRDVGCFRADPGVDVTGVKWVHVFVRIVPGKEAGFVLGWAECGRPVDR